MIADSVAFLVARGQVGRLRRRALLRRLARRPGVRAALRARRRGGGRGVGDAVRHERRLAPARGRGGDGRGRRRRWRAGRDPLPRRRRSAAWPTRSPRCARARGLVQGTMNGYGERCGNANLVSIVPNLQLKMGHECLPDLTGLTEASHYLDELLNFVPDPNRPVRRAERVRAQGRDARGRRGRRPGDVRAHRPRRGRQRARGADLRAERQGHGAAARGGDGRRARRRRRGARRRAGQAARARGLPLRGRGRLVRPADPARDRRVRSRSSGSSPGA